MFWSIMILLCFFFFIFFLTFFSQLFLFASALIQLLNIIMTFTLNPSTTDKQIPKVKTKQHSVILNVIVLMYELMSFALYWRTFGFIFYLLFDCNTRVLFMALIIFAKTKFRNIIILLCFFFLFFFFFYFLLSTCLSASVPIKLHNI